MTRRARRPALWFAALCLLGVWPLSGQPAGTELVDVPAHVAEVCPGCFALVPDEAEPGTRYQPDELPEAYRVDQLAVVFSGVVGEIPPNVRLWGTPLELTDIREPSIDNPHELDTDASTLAALASLRQTTSMSRSAALRARRLGVPSCTGCSRTAPRRRD